MLRHPRVMGKKCKKRSLLACVGDKRLARSICRQAFLTDEKEEKKFTKNIQQKAMQPIALCEMTFKYRNEILEISTRCWQIDSLENKTQLSDKLVNLFPK